jgi:hypothetical protein
MSLCVGDRLVCRLGRNCVGDRLVCRLGRNFLTCIRIRIVRKVGLLPELTRNISTHFMLYPLCSQIICWANHFPTKSESDFTVFKMGKKETKSIIAAYFDYAEHQCATF